MIIVVRPYHQSDLNQILILKNKLWKIKFTLEIIYLVPVTLSCFVLACCRGESR